MHATQNFENSSGYHDRFVEAIDHTRGAIERKKRPKERENVFCFATEGYVHPITGFTGDFNLKICFGVLNSALLIVEHAVWGPLTNSCLRLFITGLFFSRFNSGFSANRRRFTPAKRADGVGRALLMVNSRTLLEVQPT